MWGAKTRQAFQRQRLDPSNRHWAKPSQWYLYDTPMHTLLIYQWSEWVSPTQTLCRRIHHGFLDITVHSLQGIETPGEALKVKSMRIKISTEQCRTETDDDVIYLANFTGCGPVTTAVTKTRNKLYRISLWTGGILSIQWNTRIKSTNIWDESGLISEVVLIILEYFAVVCQLWSFNKCVLILGRPFSLYYMPLHMCKYWN